MKTWQILLLGLLLGLLAAGLILFLSSAPRGEPISLQVSTPGSESTSSANVGDPATIKVHIAGQVSNPGLWELPVGSRISDGIEAAGGLTGTADIDRVNLAAFLTDGKQVYIPAKGEILPETEEQDIQEQGLAAPVNINLANKEELLSLPGIGETKAEAIITFRNNNGNFLMIEDLINVPGIGESIFTQIRDLITTGN